MQEKRNDLIQPNGDEKDESNLSVGEVGLYFLVLRVFVNSSNS